MSTTSENNKRIAKNTLLLYFRMILIMLVSLYTSRVVLKQLGIEDYGIYNVVGGIVVMFSFLNSSMSTSTQRFLTLALGKGDQKGLSDVFSASLNIHILITLFIILLAETIGLWFLNTKLVIPEDRLFAANWVFQFSILTFCVNIVQVPYNATIIAHERMDIFAYISILEVFLKLGIVYLLSLASYDKLIFYAIMIFIVQLFVRLIYRIYCRRKFEECKFHLYWNKDLYKEMSGFAGWNLFGSIAWLVRGQGLDILLNLFFGPIVNAARGIASQVSGTVMSFISNFQVALNPQITKNYAQGAIKEMELLTYKGIKFSVLLLFCLAFPLCLNIDYVLNIWLTEVPEYTAVFIILIIVDAMVSSMFGSPLMTSLSATGVIRNYQITVSLLILTVIPLSYLLLKWGFNAPSVFFVMIVVSAISGFVRFLFCRLQIGYSLRLFVKKVFLPVIYSLFMAIPIPLIWKEWFTYDSTFVSFTLNCCISFLLSALSCWFIGMEKYERTMLLSMLKKKLRK